MKLHRTSTDYIDLKVISSDPTYYQNIEMIKKTSNKYATIDRGKNSDYYESVITVDGTIDEISNFANFIDFTRKYFAHAPYLTDMNISERVFGDNIDYSTFIYISILDVSEIQQFNLSRYTIDITIRTVNGWLNFIGTPTLPKINNVDHNYVFINKREQNFNDTYFGNVYINARNVIQSSCSIETILSLSDAINIQEFYRQQRKQRFQMRSEDFELDNPFNDGSSYPYTVRMMELNVIPISPNYRRVSFMLEREI